MKNTIFAFREGSPKYKQIYEHFKIFIEKGDIKTNDQLPSIRQLAESLQVSRNTTLMAYELLVAEGYIRGEGRKGYFVNELEPMLFQNVSIPTDNKETKLGKPVLIDFQTGAVDQNNFPLKAWRKIANHILTLTASYQYGKPFGEDCLREQIATYLLQSRGVKTHPDSIIIGSSTQQMLINLVHILKDEHPSIIVEDPGFDGARKVFQFHRLTLETIPVYETGIDFSKLEDMMSRLIYVTPSHQSPIGVSMTLKQRQMLIHWANELRGYIIEDDYDSEFRYSQKPLPALASIDSTRVIYIGNFSKSFLPGIRLSYMVLPQNLLDLYKRQYVNFDSTTSLISQLTMAKFMEEGEWIRHLKRMRLVYKRKMQYFVLELKKQFTHNISIIGEQAGLYLLVKLHLNRSENWLIQQASLFGVKVYPTSIYFVKNQSDEPFIKLGFSHLTSDEIQLGVKLLKKAWS
jgi:GntR family transcriptional regulator / MocR family aminotransferase